MDNEIKYIFKKALNHPKSTLDENPTQYLRSDRMLPDNEDIYGEFSGERIASKM